MPRCSGLKKQKADASVIKTIKQAAAPSAIVRDQSNEWKKRSERNFGKVAMCIHSEAYKRQGPAKVPRWVKPHLFFSICVISMTEAF